MTFDCWGTLIYEPDPGETHTRRAALVAEHAREIGLDPGAAREALDHAWSRHVSLWQEGVASGAAEIASWTLAALAERVEATLPRKAIKARNVPAPSADAVAVLAGNLAEAALVAEVQALEGARETLEALARAGVRRALICDTGFSPGRVVRRLLEHTGLLEHLEVTIFSDEAGVPKPHPRMFQRALEPLGLADEPGAVVHVGDLRRTDVAGARASGLRTVRIRHHYDDRSELPEADHVADSHAHLQELLGFRGRDATRDPDAR